VSGFYKN